ncbi:MAG: crosslink repair DNA glycosylase YcaQ family protein [Gammaproteobacteria bacterium]|nr:crosslink repair DNA glycosylase YcaQ family protein [Gammaproteobacteria bacterium]
MTSQRRRLALSKQGLVSQQPFGSGLSGTRSAIEHLGYVQIDTLSVVERAHHHVLWNRVPDYDPSHLNQLVSEQRIFEYWYHAAAYLPMRDYRYALPNMMSIRKGENRYYTNVDERLMKEILARVRAEGALRLRDFDKGGKQGNSSWWNLRAARRAFDILFMQGDLMVCKRIGMEKVYDLSERCLPAELDLSLPTLREYAAYLFDTTLRAHGVFTWKQLLHLKTGQSLRDAMRDVLNERIEAGVVQEWNRVDAPTLYVETKMLEQTPKTNLTLKLLSPFDNVLIHRDRLSLLFDFDYRMECYVAASKRVFGYFCLPILYGDTFVARMDCKAHRAERRFEVLSLHLEDVPFDQDLFSPALHDELQRFADFNQCPLLDASVVLSS